MSRIRGRIVTIARVLSPVHHGGEMHGNVNQFRRHQVWHAGEKWPVPFISGNSQKHANREGAARFGLSALGLDDSPELTRAELQLLLSGGAMTKSGQSVRIDRARAAEEAMPVLGLHGYAAGNAMQESQVRVDFLELLCAETAHKYNHEVDEYAPWAKEQCERYASDYIEVYWGTRHEPTRRRANRELLDPDVRAEIEADLGDKKDQKNPDKGDSLQMIYEFECLVPGAVLIGGYTFSDGITDHELQAWRSAFTWASEGRGPNGGLVMRVGGKASVGYGKVEVHLHGMLAEGIKPPEYRDTDDLCPPIEDAHDDELAAYIEYLRSHGDVRERLKELAG